ncbi:MAG: FtsW/RodA/SpoVE family cell cycle protein [Phycisphaeraceae bacterium]|nr:FtsW/RodA/SpoVE family cell cycle protein [Phycisphaeraceae bacterium]
MPRYADTLAIAFKPRPAWIVLIAALALTAIGIQAIGGTTEPAKAAQQFRWFGFALLALLVSLLPHPRLIGLLCYHAFTFTLLLLLILIVPGVPESLVPTDRAARSWIDLGFMNMQPSELAKIASVLALAWYLRHRDSYRTLLGLLVPFALMFIPVVMILKEPDLGSAVLFVPALFFMLVAAGAKLRHLFALVGIGVMVVALNIAMIYTLPDNLQILKSYQRKRVIEFVDRQGDQQRTAMAILGSGGVRGYGMEQSRALIRFNHLPEDHNDMIFAVVVNRWGFLGGALTLGLYLVLVLGILLVAARIKDPFGRLACAGFAGLFFCQSAINIAMTLGLLPITGITLPFVSYGGSSLLASYIIVGLVLNFAARPPAIISRPSFEHDHMESLFH